jgi:hypothetical protein
MGSSGNQTSTVKQEIPPEMKPYLFGSQGVMPLASALYNQGLDLPDYQVAGLTPYQNAAAQLGTAGIGGYMPALAAGSRSMNTGIGAATNALGMVPQALGNANQFQMGSAMTGAGATQGYDPNSYQNYMNPYMEEVVQKSLSDIGRQGQIQANDLRAQAVGQNAFGGSRQAVAERELGRNILGQQASTATQLRASGYQGAQEQAQKNFQDQQMRQGNYATLLGNLGTSYGQLGMQGVGAMQGLAGTLGNLGTAMGGLGQLGQNLGNADLNTLMGIGSMYQTQQQGVLDANRQNLYQQQMAPWQLLGNYQNVVQGMPMMPAGSSTTSAPGPSAASQIAGLGMGIGGLYQAGMFGGGAAT